MTDKHTPGPWTWGQDYNGLYGPSDSQRVLEFDNYEGMHLPDYTAEGPANARLIAAAPDLLEALRRVLEWAEAVAGDNRFAAEAAAELASIELANAAIAKAEGRP